MRYEEAKEITCVISYCCTAAWHVVFQTAVPLACMI